MKQSNKIFLANGKFAKQKKDNPHVLRIILAKDYTRIDLGYAAPWNYNRGGWIHISPNTYLSIEGSIEKYGLIRADNIPLAPQKHYFESQEDWRTFSLYFQPIPIKPCTLQIIEATNKGENYFNFHNIQLTEVNTTEIIL